MDKVSHFRKAPVIMIASVAATGGLLFGFDTGVISGAQNFLQDPAGWGVNDSQLEWITTAVLIGAVIGAALSGRIADLLGRKKVILFTAVIFAIGALWTGAAGSVSSLVIGRMVIGVAIGVASFTVPLYISEVSPAGNRGSLVSLNQLMIAIGILVSYISDYLIANDADPYSWRWMFYVGVFPALLLFIGMIFLPETPRWLMKKGRAEESRKILSKVERPELVDKAVQDMQKDILRESEKEGWDGLFRPWLRNPLIIGMGIMFFQQMTGINTIIYYSPKIFRIAGIESNAMTILPSVILGIFIVICTIVSVLIIDRVGRRPLFFTGLSGMVLGLIGIGFAFHFENQLGDSLKYIAMICMLFYVGFFSISLGPLGWLILSEIFPLKVRGIGMSMGSLSNWVFNGIIAFTFLKLVNALTPSGAFWLYALLGILSIIWGYHFIPETKGVTLEQIEEHWRKRRPPSTLNRKKTELTKPVN